MHKDFIGFCQIPDISSNAIESVLQDALIRLQLSLDECRGQCYGSSTNMLVKIGVATKIQEKQPKAFPTHYHCYSLKLVVKDSRSYYQMQLTSRYSVGKAPDYRPTALRDNYRRTYFKAFNLPKSHIEQRFQQPSFETLQRLDSLLLESLED